MPLDYRLTPLNPRKLGTSIALACVLAVSACGKKEEAAPTAAATDPAAGASPQAVVAPAAPEITAGQLVASATKAVTEQRLVAPAGDNAIEYYLQALAKEPNNVSATQALVDLFPLAAGNAEREIVNRNLDEAARIIALLDQASPGSYTVSTLKSKLNAARTQMQREEERRLAQEAAAEQQRAQAAAAAAAPPPTAPASTAAAQPSRPAPAEPRPTEPAASTAAAAPPPTAPAQPAAESRDPVLVRQVRPTYPAAAARRKQEGWVEVQFTVAENGDVTDTSVVRSQPRGVFDRDAVRAVSQWRFEPALDNGKAVPRTLTRRIEFTLRAQ
jgi:protein TonB